MTVNLGLNSAAKINLGRANLWLDLNGNSMQTTKGSAKVAKRSNFDDSASERVSCNIAG